MKSWDATIVTAIFSGIVLVIGAIVTGTIAIIKAIRDTSTETNKKVDNVQDINNKQVVQLKDIKLVVNGRYEDVLKRLSVMKYELADVKQALATATGFKIDQDKADAALNLANMKDEPKHGTD